MKEKSKGQNKSLGKEDQGSISRNDREDRGRQNASATRGGTTDMDDDALTTGRGGNSRVGSGISTKRTVTGSDYDGQVAPE